MRVRRKVEGEIGHDHQVNKDIKDSLDLYISRTLLGEVIEEKKVVAYVDTSQDEKLARAESIIATARAALPQLRWPAAFRW